MNMFQKSLTTIALTLSMTTAVNADNQNDTSSNSSTNTNTYNATRSPDDTYKCPINTTDQIQLCIAKPPEVFSCDKTDKNLAPHVTNATAELTTAFKDFKKTWKKKSTDLEKTKAVLNLSFMSSTLNYSIEFARKFMEETNSVTMPDGNLPAFPCEFNVTHDAINTAIEQNIKTINTAKNINAQSQNPALTL